MIVRHTLPPTPRLFGRRGFLTSTGATLLYAALAPVASARTAAAQGLGDYPFTLGVASGDPTADGVVLWTRLAPRPFEGGGMPDASHRRAMAGVDRRAHGPHRPARRRAGDAGARSLCACRGQRPRAVALVLVSVQGRQRSEPGGAHAHRARGRSDRGSAFRVRVVPALCARLLLRTQASGRRGSRLRGAPGRLHLRRPRDRHHRPGAPARRRDHVDRGLPDSLRGLQIRSGSAGGSCGVPVDRHLGRSRD